MQHSIAGRGQFPLIVLAALGVSLATSCGRAQSVPADKAPPSKSQPDKAASPAAARPPVKPEPVQTTPAAHAPEKGVPTTAEKKPRPANRLAKETSPYLLLHAHNPVDWYPWGEEAFAKAKDENKLIFLSIGYSSCYWCHVMERESFMDDEIAALSEQALRVHQGRPRGAARRRRNLHDGAAGLLSGHRFARRGLAAVDVPDARRQAALPAARTSRREKAQTWTAFCRWWAASTTIWQKNPDGVKKTATQLTDFVRQTLRRRAGLPTPCRARRSSSRCRQALAEEYDARHGGFGFSEANPRSPNSPSLRTCCFCWTACDAAVMPKTVRKKTATRRWRRGCPCDACRHTGEDGGRWHSRRLGGRLSSLRHRSLLAHSALRKDAVRQRPVGHGLRRSLGAHRQSAVQASRGGTTGVRRA